MNQRESYRLARREILLRLAATGALGAGGFAALVRDAFGAGSVAANPGMRHIRGPVSVDAARATIGLAIKPGQTVNTGPGAEVVYVIGSNAFMQRENSTIRFGDGIGADTLRVITGKLLGVFGKGNRLLVTPTATIGIRGTGCYIESEQARTYFCLCYGEAEVTPMADPKQKETVRTRHHDHPIYISASGDKMLAPATVINHTDAELTLLEAAVGRTPPFAGDAERKY